MDTTTLVGLDADEILATRENFRSAARLESGPIARRIPESLCQEIEKQLCLLEFAVREGQIIWNP